MKKKQYEVIEVIAFVITYDETPGIYNFFISS